MTTTTSESETPPGDPWEEKGKKKKTGQRAFVSDMGEKGKMFIVYNVASPKAGLWYYNQVTRLKLEDAIALEFLTAEEAETLLCLPKMPSIFGKNYSGEPPQI